MIGKSSLTKFYPKATAIHFFFYDTVILLLTIWGLRFDLARSHSYNLVLDSVNSPPAVIPSDPKDLVYSVPLNQLTSRPTVAYIQDKTGKTVPLNSANIEVHVTSMDKYQKKPEDPDQWRDSGGMFCQWSNPDEEWPERLNRELYNTVCGSSLRTTTLIMKVLNGKVIMDWLKHVHPTGTLPPEDRFIRIEIPNLKLIKDTNLFKITEPAASLHITKQPSKSIIANNKFDITAEIRDRKGVVLTVGLDSVAYVELTVSYNSKFFHHVYGKGMLLESTETRLGGPSVSVYEATRDLVIRQRAVAGKISFSDVRLLDPIYNLRLNLTMYMSKDPFLRIPSCEKCYSDLHYKIISSDGLIKFAMPPASILKDIPSMEFTHEFNVLPQTFGKLKYISNYEGKGKMRITRNFPIEGPLTIETLDATGNRIYSGPDSNLPLEVKTIPSGVCLSSDSSIHSYAGITKFQGSICDIRSSVFLVFYLRKMPTVNVTSHELEVIGDVHIAHFDHFKYTGGGRALSPHINSFIRFAANDVNKGILAGVLKQFNMKLIIDTIETNDDISYTILQKKNLHEIAHQNPGDAIRAVILSGNSQVISAIATESVHHHTTLISLDEKDEKYTYFPFYNRICWNSRQIYHAFIKFCIQRYWNRMIVLKTSNTEPASSLNYFARMFKVDLVEIEINAEKVHWKSGDPDFNKALSQAMEAVKKEEIKVITCFANYSQMPDILYIAKEEGLSSEDGYQWVLVSEYAWAFPFNNTSPCDLFPECTTVFGGTILITETYNTSFFRTDDWERVLNYYYTVDKSIYLGLSSVYPNTDRGSRIALGYDAIWLYSKALTNIVMENLTATTEKITKELRRVKFVGLTGMLHLDEYGDRDMFQTDVRIVNVSQPQQPMEIVAPLYKYIVMRHKKFYMEYVYDDDKNTTAKTILPIRLPKATIYNTYSFLSTSGRVSKINFEVIRYSNEAWPSKSITRQERTLPPFTCAQPCGNIAGEYDVNLYDRGKCISMNQCYCLPGYFGSQCEHKMCHCIHGYCIEPNMCTCYNGYKGNTCNIPICHGGCKNGKCVQPDKCQCFQSFWVGRQCQLHLAAILVPFIIIMILFIYLAYTFLIFFQRRIERANALSNLDWLVDWQEVVQVDKNSNTLKSMAFANSIGNMTNSVYFWKKQKWFVKKLNSYTVDEDDENVRLEMVELISIKHQNLITYGGACLVNPNVSFLVEPTHKGSLEDILINQTIQLDWNFRFSFMKDICRGMNYLHSKTKIGSHGRLKSSNCLLDNRWCIRITDFGAPTIRYGPYLIEKGESDKSEENDSMQEALLWTAPELLETASCLDDVRMGTKEGDIYSFGIVVSEIATRDVPFAYERGVLSARALIDLIVNRDNPALVNELKTWKSLNSNSNFVRPQILPDYLPERKTEKNKFRKMLDDVWDNDPIARISFQKLGSVLDNIFPTKEELMDNLMHLLELYSKNLEHVVIERTDALEAEKTKVENIVSQMLPKKVIEELKNGNKVEPENFECVTVYYSDIVGFTTIAKNCQPMQVVDLLNDLYSVFDSILKEYDVYKVETIGDAYVVSSGVPTLNDNLHAGEIATASLDILSAIMTMESPHLPHVKLQLRLGISSGPVVAGVVGVKMPRYTIFGETMQIASTMESSSKPMHIQMSEFTVTLLQELGGYSMRYRGNMNICGKTINTYWLTGKTSYPKPLPMFVDD